MTPKNSEVGGKKVDFIKKKFALYYFMSDIFWSVAGEFEKIRKYSNNYLPPGEEKNEVLPAFFMAHKCKFIK